MPYQQFVEEMVELQVTKPDQGGGGWVAAGKQSFERLVTAGKGDAVPKRTTPLKCEQLMPIGTLTELHLEKEDQPGAVLMEIKKVSNDQKLLDIPNKQHSKACARTHTHAQDAQHIRTHKRTHAHTHTYTHNTHTHTHTHNTHSHNTFRAFNELIE